MNQKNKKVAEILAISLVALLIISSAQPAQAFDPLSAITNVWTSIWNGVTSFFNVAGKVASSSISAISTSVGSMKFEAFSFQNFAPIAFSNIQYISQGADSRLGGDFIQATVNLGTGSASSVEAAIDKTQTDDGKYMFKNRFSIGFSVDKQSCDWDIAKTSSNIYRYSSESKGTCYLASTCSGLANKECSVLSDGLQHGAIVAPSSFFSLDPFQVYCLKEEIVASVGTFSDTATYKFIATITLKNGTESYPATITNTGQSDVDVGLGTVARAQFVGLLSSGQACGSTFGQDGTAKAKYVPINDLSGNWKIVSKDSYDNYYQFKNSPGFGACYAVGSTRGTANLDACVVSMNSVSNKAQEQIAIGNINQIKTDSAVLSLIPNNLLQYPQITLKVRASWAGVVENAGLPEIISLSSAKFRTGDTGTIIATIKNSGDFDGHFKVFAECESGFLQSGTVLTVPTIQPKSTMSISIPIVSPTNVSEDISKYCTVKVYDAATPLHIVSQKVMVSASPIAKCVPGDEQCVLLDIQKCTASGQWAFKETCKIGCKEDLGVANCYAPGIESGITEAQLSKLLIKDKTGTQSDSDLCYYASAQKLVGLSVFNPFAYVSKWLSDAKCWYNENTGNVIIAGVVGTLTALFTFIIFSRLPFLQGMPWIVFLIPIIAAMYVAFKYTYIGGMILAFELAILVVSMFA